MVYSGKKISPASPNVAQATNQEKVLITINNNIADLVNNLATTAQILEQQLKSIKAELNYIKTKIK